MGEEERRENLVRAITSPLGFYVLALLVVEMFLGTVLIGASLTEEHKVMFVWVGVGLFIVVFVTVTWLVVRYPESLTFGATAHIERLKLVHVREKQIIAPLAELPPVQPPENKVLNSGPG